MYNILYLSYDDIRVIYCFKNPKFEVNGFFFQDECFVLYDVVGALEFQVIRDHVFSLLRVY